MKLMILDGNSIINRAFYGVRLLTTREGLYTNAIFGFLNILEKLRNEEQPDALAVAFDLKAPTFRHLQYEGYKATRHAMPEELAQQMPLMKDVLRAMNIPIFECEGLGGRRHLGTAGQDLRRVRLGLRDRHGRPRQFAARGGARVGQARRDPRRADEHDAVYAGGLRGGVWLRADPDDRPQEPDGRQLGQHSGRGGRRPEDGDAAARAVWHAGRRVCASGRIEGLGAQKARGRRESAYLSYDLATIRCEAPVDFRPEDCLVREADNDALWALFQKLEFSRLAARYHLHPPKPAEPEVYEGECQSEIVTDAARAEALLRQFAEKERVFLLFSADHSSVAVMDDGDTAWLFSRKALGEGYEAFLRGLCAGNIRKVTHDVKETMRFLLGRICPSRASALTQR